MTFRERTAGARLQGALERQCSSFIRELDQYVESPGSAIGRV